MSVVQAMHELALPEAGDLRLSQPPSIFVMPVSGLPMMVGRSTNQKLPRVL